MRMRFVNSLLLSTALCSVSSLAAISAETGNRDLDSIVVTASTGERSKLESSLSVTDVSPELIDSFAPQSVSEALRVIPGIIANSSSPGGNANISVRGLPVLTGGNPFIQFQEDGLPTVLWGDIDFGNSDYWTRMNVGNRIEAVRGGSVSTLTSQAPGAVINFITEDGSTKGGFVDLMRGLNYDQTRFDFAYGGPIAPDLRYHIEGFYNYGEGTRQIPWAAENGYQIKANITKTFEEGFIRLDLKRLDDQEPTTIGEPVIANGNLKLINGNLVGNVTSYSLAPGLNALTQSNMSAYNKSWLYVNDQGKLSTITNQGNHPESTAIGGEFKYNITPNLTIDDRFRQNFMSGVFATSFYGLGANNGGLTYANGPQAGQAYTGTYIQSSTNIYTKMKDMGSSINDLSLSGKSDFGNFGKVSVKSGFFYAHETINQVWAPNGYQQAYGYNGALLNSSTSYMGQTNYGSNWGASVAREFLIDVDDYAPYTNVNWDKDAWHIEGGLRYDQLHAQGWGAQADSSTQTTINGLTAYYPNLNNKFYRNYDVGYTSYTMGVLYDFNKDATGFVRFSEGGRGNIERRWYNSSDFNAAGNKLTAAGKQNASSIVDQEEVGIKTRTDLLGGRAGLNITGFHATFDAISYDLTTQKTSGGKYESYGVEVESNYHIGGFGMLFNVTFDHSKVNNADGSGTFTPHGQPSVDWLWSPSYTWNRVQGGAIIHGMTSMYQDDSGLLKGPDQYEIDLYAQYEPIDNVQIRLNAKNITNALIQMGGTVGNGITAALPNGKYLQASGFDVGRIFSLTATYRF